MSASESSKHTSNLNAAATAATSTEEDITATAFASVEQENNHVTAKSSDAFTNDSREGNEKNKMHEEKSAKVADEDADSKEKEGAKEEKKPSPPQAPLPVNVIPPVDSTIIRVSGLPFSITPAQLRSFFRGFDVSADEDAIVIFSCGDHRGDGFVRMTHSDDVARAVEKLNRNRIGERYLELTVSSEEERANAIAERDECLSLNGAFVLRLRGLPFSSTEDDVREFLKTVEGIVRLEMCRDMDGRNTGDAFIEVENAENVKQAKALHEKTLGPRYIEVIDSTPFDRTFIMNSASRRSRNRGQNGGGGMASGRGMRTSMPYQRYSDYQHYQQQSMMGMYGFQQLQQQQAMGYGMYGARGGGAYGRSRWVPRSGYGSQGMYMSYDMVEPFSNMMMEGRTEGSSSYAGQQYGAGAMASSSMGMQSPLSSGGNNNYGGGTSGMSMPPYAGRGFYESTYASQREPSKHVVRIRGLPFSATENLVAQFFEGVQIPPQGVHMVYNGVNNPTGEAFVELQGTEDMQKALARSGGAMGHRYIEVFESSPAEMQRLGLQTLFAAEAEAMAMTGVDYQQPNAFDAFGFY